MTKGTRLITLGTATILSLCVATTQGQEAQAADTAVNAEPQATTRPRFGVGWDDGIAFRARVGSRWGVGVRVNPDLVDSKMDDATSYSSHEHGTDGPILYRDAASSGPDWSSDGSSTSDSNNKDNAKTLGLAAMVYYERDFGRWFAAGPYVALSYTRQTYDTTQHLHDTSSWNYASQMWPSSNDYTSWTDVDTRHWERSLGAELGVRPVLRLNDHFVLETRFGVELLSTKWTEKGTQTQRWDSSSGGGSLEPPVPRLDIVPRQSGQGTSETTIDNSGSSTRFHAVGDRVISDVQVRFVVFF